MCVCVRAHLGISKVNDSNDKGGERKINIILLLLSKYSHSLWSGIVLFESRFGLVVSVYCKFKTIVRGEKSIPNILY